MTRQEQRRLEELFDQHEAHANALAFKTDDIAYVRHVMDRLSRWLLTRVKQEMPHLMVEQGAQEFLSSLLGAVDMLLLMHWR